MQALRAARVAAEAGAAKLQGTRRAVLQGWHAVADQLLSEGHPQLAQQVWKLIGGMPAPQTDDQRLQSTLATKVDAHRRQERTR